MPRRLRLRRIAAWVVLGAVGGLLAGYAVLPWIVQAVAQARLAELGWPKAQLGVSWVGPWSLSGRGLAVSDDPRTPRADELQVTYSPTSLWRGRVTRIRIEGWRVDAELVGGSLRVMGVELPSDGSSSSEGLSLDWLRALPLDVLELGRGRLTVHLSDGASVDVPFSGLQLSQGSMADSWMAAGGIELPGARIELAGELRRKDLGAARGYEAELNITSQDVDLTKCLDLPGDAQSGRVLRVGRASLRAMLSSEPGTPQPSITATLKLTGIDATVPAWGLAVKDASVDWPLRWAAQMTGEERDAARGHLAIPPFGLLGGSWPGITGVVSQDGLTWTAGLSLPLDETSPLAATLTLAVRRQPLGVTASMRVGDAPAGQLAEMIGRLTASQFIKGLSFEGDWGAGVDWRWPGMDGPAADVQLKNLTVRSVDRDVSAEGLTGAIHWDTLDALATPGTQRVTFRGGHSGPLAVGEGVVEFRLLDGEEAPRGGVFVERAVCGFGRTGRLAAYAFPIRFDQPRFDFELMLESVGIQDLLTLMTTTQVRGEGLLYGRVPVSIDLERAGMIALGHGYVFAQPGEGWLAVSDPRWLEGTLGAADASVTGQIQHQAIEALTDYQYERLAFYVDPTDEGLVIRMETSGRGRQGPNPLEIGSLRINIKGADLWLNEWLRPARGSPQAVDHALDRYMP